MVNMYNEGELIVYGASGVCRVGEKTQMDGKDYLMLHPVYQRETIYMPLFSDKIFTRPVITREAAEELICSVINMTAEPVYESKVQLLSQRYDKVLKTYQCHELMYLVMSIYNKRVAAEKNRRKLGLVDERFLKKAEDLLYGELAVALGIPREKVPEYIKLRVELIEKNK
ncbi:MAG: hypothetical protein E7432_09570 [Ruminococcaceae bacterium]|nr:hypothetical protein [Oscillospiraceae bacterium]